MYRFLFLFLGGLFGFLLSRAGATTYDFYAKLFLFQHFQLLWVIMTAVVVGIAGVLLLKKLQPHSVLGRQPLSLQGKPYTKTLLPGSLIFGMGWGLAGACPGTVLAMLGEGKLGALFTVLGILGGVYLHGVQMSRRRTTLSLPVNAISRGVQKQEC